MKVKDVGSSLPETTSRTDTVEVAARQMDDHGVGTLVVTDNGKIDGIITDRDIVTRCIASRLPADSTLVGDIMSVEVLTVADDEEIETALEIMADEVVRRLVIVDGDHRVVGVLSLDDVLDGILAATEDVGRLIRRQVFS